MRAQVVVLATPALDEDLGLKQPVKALEVEAFPQLAVEGLDVAFSATLPGIGCASRTRMTTSNALSPSPADAELRSANTSRSEAPSHVPCSRPRTGTVSSYRTFPYNRTASS